MMEVGIISDLAAFISLDVNVCEWRNTSGRLDTASKQQGVWTCEMWV